MKQHLIMILILEIRKLEKKVIQSIRSQILEGYFEFVIMCSIYEVTNTAVSFWVEVNVGEGGSLTETRRLGGRWICV